ncbi:hypothetical protein CENSYa_2049 [Cenarchaeum symbiosum A]|uniref:Uncharacterized protein n=1 Tax=Cenarchaeum symbiosum (strain A) TaxID=414004 RepID=A0RZ85_CENSY|nr:hypothetical protein CENSYa_2049 [Cenarchaeum symbiosum A]
MYQIYKSENVKAKPFNPQAHSSTSPVNNVANRTFRLIVGEGGSRADTKGLRWKISSIYVVNISQMKRNMMIMKR